MKLWFMKRVTVFDDVAAINRKRQTEQVVGNEKRTTKAHEGKELHPDLDVQSRSRPTDR